MFTVTLVSKLTLLYHGTYNLGYKTVLLLVSQKGAIAIKRCSTENQKGAIAV